MSNSYLQFAMSFPLKTRAEQDWCTKTINALTDLLECSGESDPEETLSIKRKGVRRDYVLVIIPGDR